jgi:biotin operon repressor
MKTRAQKVIAALSSAKGLWLDSDTLSAQLGIGKPQVAAAISEARAMGVTIETHRCRGVGWRIDPAAAMVAAPRPAAPQPAAPPAAPPAASPLSKAAATILELLQQAGGDYVAGRVLAAAIDKPIESLPTYASELRAKMPALRLEGKRGQGYRLGALATTADLPPSPLPVMNRDRATRTSIDLLATLLPATAEKVRTVALEAGEPVQKTLHRLIEYGIEVNLDLIVHGHHPMQLGRAA